MLQHWQCHCRKDCATAAVAVSKQHELSQMIFLKVYWLQFKQRALHLAAARKLHALHG